MGLLTFQTGKEPTHPQTKSLPWIRIRRTRPTQLVR